MAERMVAKIRERMTHLRVGDSLDKVRYLSSRDPRLSTSCC